MRWHLKNESWEGPWEEPVTVRPRKGTPRTTLCSLWAVPTQEGFALQVNSLLSVLTLAKLLNRTAVVMPLLLTGPHYRKDVALGLLPPTMPMSTVLDLDAFGVRYVEFDDVTLPKKTKCASCASSRSKKPPPPHVRCARGWDYQWCDRAFVTRRKCTALFGCGSCIFSVGLAPAVRAKHGPTWESLRKKMSLRRRPPRDETPPPYCALQMRRGDKSAYLDRQGLTADYVLRKATRLCGGVGGGKKILATDDRSNATRTLASTFGFELTNDGPNALATYLSDLATCVDATVFVGTASKKFRSKQTGLILALRAAAAGKKKKNLSSSSSSHVITL